MACAPSTPVNKQIPIKLVMSRRRDASLSSMSSSLLLSRAAVLSFMEFGSAIIGVALLGSTKHEISWRLLLLHARVVATASGDLVVGGANESMP